jgi:hypothetical protein
MAVNCITTTIGQNQRSYRSANTVAGNGDRRIFVHQASRPGFEEVPECCQQKTPSK